VQWGFIHNNVDCIGCRACEIACKDKNGLAPGPRFRRVMYIEGGTYPEVFAFKVNMSCNHCAQPACLPTCPTGAIFKRQTGRHRRHRLHALHRLPPLRGRLPLMARRNMIRRRTSSRNATCASMKWMPDANPIASWPA
jgi:ferredoxin